MKSKLILAFWIGFTCLSGLFSQTKTGDLELYLNSIIDLLPGSSGNDFIQPDENQLLTWEEMLLLLLDGDINQARQKASLLNYQVIIFEDNTGPNLEKYYLIEENASKVYYWGTYVLSFNPDRPQLVLQAPHTVFDTNTGRQAVYCFTRLGAYALFISGTHRCNHSSSSSCSGTTSVCGTSGPYKISDNAHNVLSAFQRTTEIMFNETDSTYFVQLHGFAKLSSDPYLIMSNGTRITPDPDYIWELQSELQEVDDVLTFKSAHLDPEWTRLIAFSNTQGRYINGSLDPCGTNAVECSGRFIHIEQEKSRLRADSLAWWKMYTALSNTFTASDPGSYTKNEIRSLFKIYPNPTSDVIHIESDGPFNMILFKVNGQILYTSQTIEDHGEIDLRTFGRGIYLVRIVTRESSFTQKIILR